MSLNLLNLVRQQQNMILQPKDHISMGLTK